MTLNPALERMVSKTVAAGLLLAAIWFVSAAVVAPLISRLGDAQDQIAQERQLLGRLLEEARTISARPASQDSGEPGFLAGETDAEKISALQSRVEAVAAATGVRLSSLQPMPETSQGPLRLISLRAVAAGSMDQVQRFLHGLEGGPPSLMIQSLDIGPTARTSEPTGELDLRLNIVGVVPGDGVQP